ncbi:MAG TPA: DUF948 domain-containing protein [Chondromyces sp.]|nr:DUF948 domain-containing protein [Chondromyces sp.]
MWIVYLSLALVVGSLIYLGYSGYKTYKSAKPKIDHITEVANRMQQRTQTIKAETDVLTKNQQEIMLDVEEKKEAVQSTVNVAKQTPQTAKQLAKTAVNELKGTRRTRSGKRFKVQY